MWALIAFIALGIVVATLIEVNERIKAKNKKENCPPEKVGSDDCADCGLAEACTKSKKPTAVQ